MFVDPRTKPGLQGQSLISSGLADLDALLGGGLPLGSITLILEDGYSRLHETFLQYFLAEGAASSQVGMVGMGLDHSRRSMLTVLLLVLAEHFIGVGRFEQYP